MFKKLLIIFAVFILLIGGVFILLYWMYSRGDLAKIVVDKVAKEFVERSGNQSVTSTIQETNFIKKLLGFGEAQTYVMLFLNNTELRPGGGFIGSYATVKIENGVPHILKTEGTEILDYSGYPMFSYPPPEPIKTYLKLDHLFFRDSNWSPDFASSSVVSLDLYKKQRGIAADEVTAVVGITTQVLEELLKVTGPVTVNGEEFTSANVVEKLQYEVEQAFDDKGIARRDRKQILIDLVGAMKTRLAKDILLHWGKYFDLAQRLLREKQIAIYAVNPADQAIIRAKNWGGEMLSPSGDYLLWADGNLGALKTDAALKREVSYHLTPSGDSYVATVIMRYIHQGTNDWRTSRYVSYARVFVPTGSRLIASRGLSKNANGAVTSVPDQGTENGRQWFGGLVLVETQSAKEVMFQYVVSPAVAEQIKKGSYTLLIQKQIGTVDPRLTLGLDFGTTITNAAPASQAGVGTKYSVVTDLRTDQWFELKLK